MKWIAEYRIVESVSFSTKQNGKANEEREQQQKMSKETTATIYLDVIKSRCKDKEWNEMKIFKFSLRFYTVSRFDKCSQRIYSHAHTQFFCLLCRSPSLSIYLHICANKFRCIDIIHLYNINVQSLTQFEMLNFGARFSLFFRCNAWLYHQLENCTRSHEKITET